ncbi:MAG: hypothetical protein JNK49_20260 [Planctomycetes bacterium]|nr:hypothetical protein [Planctomycetota bacterium]
MTPLDLPTCLVGTDLSAPFARSDAPFRLVRLSGPDAGDFLQRLCSQDVLGAAPGEVRPAAFLDAKGKLQATAQVFRLEDACWLEVPAEQAERLQALLERYHFTEKLRIELLPAVPVAEQIWHAGSSADQRAERHGGALLVGVARNGIACHRVHGATPSAVLVEAPGRERPVVPRPLDERRAECARMVGGWVRVGLETEPTTLALEAALDDHCSTHKGCYTGQEIVARIHTYGHTNRRLCLLQLAEGPAIVAPEPLLEPADRIPVGRVMHAVELPSGVGPGRLGLGYLPTDFQAPGSQLLLGSGSAVQVLRQAGPLPA